VLITGENAPQRPGGADPAFEFAAVDAPAADGQYGRPGGSIFESELSATSKARSRMQDRPRRPFRNGDGGTLFLDEIANISQALQGKLLRTLETGEFERVGSSKSRRVDVRVSRHQRRSARRGG